ncbi:glycoside hydrolase family 2 TIM barrel-domain containing protein [Paramicrobacterium agarici]|uniref:glycoside hydrolase family 2 TIM barrel-domain containing protein n=1 Tax=Paramicrobacterium agarici TaxID=630514 RepID=UPI00114F5AE1|nr:glycoside hydrolase family 2 TIM barrel-domain containing protein [Microbacterium agarici]TQO23191.1 beta-galactosidase [Microbacterium agarici]
MTSYLTDPGPGSGARTPARSRLHTDAPTLSLNGDWRFRLLSGAPGEVGAAGVLPAGEGVNDVARTDFDDASWNSIPVPSHWVLQGDGSYGAPIYTNVQFPFAIDAPNVPDENPTGDYRRTFELPAEWSDAAQVLLRFDGVESRYKVWVNGIEIGVGSGSRLAQEFDVTDAVATGENTIAVRVHQWSAASYVEDQDQWWLPGIFRDVTLQARPAGCIDDVWLRAGLGEDGSGLITPQLTASDAAFPVSLRVAELGVDVEWASPADIAPVRVDAVEPWSAETPRLYDAVVSSAGETVSLRLGFRTVRIEGDQFLVNGERVVFHGVNRHETHPDRGRVFDEEWTRADLALMKRFNVNAIRTSHYPPHPRVLDIADELGFWVILECDLETHGFERGGWAGNPSDDPAWRDAYLDRIERTVERDKNHPSIVMWSLGNESGTGQNLAAMSAWVHDRDPERPVHYEGDYTGAYTDVYSRMYSSVPETDAIGRDDSRSLLLGCTAPESARQRTKPFILCEYIHAMGNGPGAIDQYEDLVWQHPRLHGGFVWEWRDHGLRTREADGTEYFGYGGDFGEVVHDGNFVMDGMVLSDNTPSPGLHEYKQVVAPVRLAVTRGGDGALVLHIENRKHSADTGDLEFRWRVEADGVESSSGVVEVDAVVAGSRASVAMPALDVPDEGEVWLTVEAVLRDDAAWAPSGHGIVFTQVDLAPQRSTLTAPWLAASDVSSDVAAHLVLGPARFEHGQLVELAGQPVSGPRLELWRGPTDNDRGQGRGSYERIDPWLNNGNGEPAPAYDTIWREAGLDRLTPRIELVETGDTAVHVRRRWAAANSRDSVVTDERWQLVDGELWLRADITPTSGWDIVWPRVGLRFDLPGDVDAASWFGTGPLESYPDTRHAARVGRFEATRDTLTVSYSRPQETGHRSDVRSLTMQREGSDWLRMDAAPDASGRRPGFTLTRHTAQQLDAARHPHELPETGAAYLYVDAAQNGVGSRACGPDVWPDSMLRPEARTLTLRFSAP